MIIPFAVVTLALPIATFVLVLLTHRAGTPGEETPGLAFWGCLTVVAADPPSRFFH